MKLIANLLLALLLVSFTARSAAAQTTVALGTPAFGSFAGGPDTLNLANLNVHWNFSIVNKAGRGLPFTYSIPFDSTV
jgi:hypothetical protein